MAIGLPLRKICVWARSNASIWVGPATAGLAPILRLLGRSIHSIESVVADVHAVGLIVKWRLNTLIWKPIGRLDARVADEVRVVPAHVAPTEPNRQAKAALDGPIEPWHDDHVLGCRTIDAVKELDAAKNKHVVCVIVLRRFVVMVQANGPTGLAVEVDGEDQIVGNGLCLWRDAKLPSSVSLRFI